LHADCIITSVQGVDVQNLIKIDSAIAALRMREKTGFGLVFCLYIRLSVLRHAYRSHFYGDFNA